MTEEQNKLADRLQAMLDQVGHPDYSLRELYEGLKLIVWELREREPATDAVRDQVLEEIAGRLANRTVPDLPGWREAIMADVEYVRALKGKGASQDGNSSRLARLENTRRC